MSKRIRARVVPHWPVDYRHGAEQHQGIIMDLASQGCRIKGASRFFCGTCIKFQVWLPNQTEPVTVEQAVVRWSLDNQFDVSFLEMPPDARARLAQAFQLLSEVQQSATRIIPVFACFVANREQNAALPPPEIRVRIDIV